MAGRLIDDLYAFWRTFLQEENQCIKMNWLENAMRPMPYVPVLGLDCEQGKLNNSNGFKDYCPSISTSSLINQVIGNARRQYVREMLSRS